jgi:copper homeostasis protein
MVRILEVCANSATSCIEAEAGGAKRVELCTGMAEGGLTPSVGEIKTVLAHTSRLDVNVMIRPRQFYLIFLKCDNCLFYRGDFLYSEVEIETMLYDIEECKKLKVHGVVFGVLTKDGDVDVPLLKRLVLASKPLSVTFHRAFDVTRDPFKALEDIIDCGVDRILTSGQQDKVCNECVWFYAFF